MSSWTHITLNLDDDVTFRLSDPDPDACRVTMEVGSKDLALLWLTRKAADGLIAAIQEAKERAWPAPQGIEADPVIHYGSTGGWWACGAWVPSHNVTDDPAKVTCPACAAWVEQNVPPPVEPDPHLAESLDVWREAHEAESGEEPGEEEG